MDFSTSDKFPAIFSLNSGAVRWAAHCAYNCIKKNIFPESVSKQC